MLGGLTNAHFTALYFTDIAETLSYIKVVSWLIIIESIIFIIPLILLIKGLKIIKFNIKFSWFLIVLCTLFTFFKIYKNRLELSKQKEYSYKTVYVSPFRVITKTIFMYEIVKRDLNLQKNLQKVPSSWKVQYSKPDKVYVVIIGESVRRDFVEPYNNNFHSSPFLSSIHKIQFNNAISFAGQTQESLSNALVLSENNKVFFPNNIVTLTKSAGYNVDWISNQGSIAGSDNFIAAMAKQSNYYKFITRGKGATFENDSLLLVPFRERVKHESNKDRVFFLHLMGSHPSPCDITNGKYNEYSLSKDVSCYLESIKRTDTFIKNVFDILKSRYNDNFNLIYFADHGLFLSNDKTLYHHTKYKQDYEVPFFIIDPKLKENIYINEPRNLKDFLIFYTQLLNIQTSNIKPTYQFISEEKAPNPYKLYNDIDYRELKDNPIPKE
jgi:glucan phosphoethanolaminetransferase (alkaline phosphatase superfamily)